MRTRFIAAIIFLVSLIFIGLIYFVDSEKYIYLPPIKTLVKEFEKTTPITMVLGGDVMLARDVERRLQDKSPEYALGFIKDRLQADITLVNFEGAIPAEHEPTENMEFKFSVSKNLLSVILNSGITHLSLANNHSLDFKEEGYKNTTEVLDRKGFVAGGHPVKISSSSVFTYKKNEKKVVIVNINATYSYPDVKNVLAVVPELEENDLLVAFIHWGEEYELDHNEKQSEFAHALVDGGFDLIVGHHPHVVQDIEKYKDSLIFYSLGNFIFDQYWQDDVQEGLLLSLEEDKNNWNIELVPVESKTERLQPREMIGEVRKRFLLELAERSENSLRSDITTGELKLQF